MSKLAGYGMWGFTSSALVVLCFPHFQYQEQLVYADASRLFHQYQGETNAREAYQDSPTVWQSSIARLVSRHKILQSNISKKRSYPLLRDVHHDL